MVVGYYICCKGKRVLKRHRTGRAKMTMFEQENEERSVQETYSTHFKQRSSKNNLNTDHSDTYCFNNTMMMNGHGTHADEPEVKTYLEEICCKLDSVEMDDHETATKENGVENGWNHYRRPAVDDTGFSTSAIYARDRDGDTMLHTAIILQEFWLAMYFISKASSVTLLSLQNLLFQTPLHLATLTNQPDVVRRLVVGGAKLESRDKDGNTALHIACRDGLVKIVNYLLEPVKYQETMQNSYLLPYQTIPQDMTIANYEGLSCLHLAAMNRRLDIVEILMKKDIDVNLKDGKTGRTILHNACLSGDIKLVRLLLSHKSCNINARAYDESTPFDLARARAHEDVCIALAAAGARYGDEYSDSE